MKKKCAPRTGKEKTHLLPGYSGRIINFLRPWQVIPVTARWEITNANCQKMNTILAAQSARILDQWWGWLIGVAVLLVLVLIAAWITSGNKRFSRNYNSAMRIITDRYGKGEIDSKEYERLVKELQEKHGKQDKKARSGNKK